MYIIHIYIHLFCWFPYSHGIHSQKQPGPLSAADLWRPRQLVRLAAGLGTQVYTTNTGKRHIDGWMDGLSDR